MATYDVYVDRSSPNTPGSGTVSDPYRSLAICENAEQGNYADGDILIIHCKDASAVTDNYTVFAGWTATGIIIKLVGDRGSAPYRINVTNNSNHGILIGTGGPVGGFFVDYFDITAAPAVGSVSSIASVAVACPLTVTNTILRSSNAYGLYAGSAATYRLFNCLIYGNTTAGIRSFVNSGTPTVNCYNTTVYNNTTGISRSGGTVSLYNNYIGGNSTANVTGTISAADNNVFSDATGVGTNKAVSKDQYTSYFTDPANGDFTPKDTSVNLWGIAGADQTAAFSDAGISPPVDMVGTERAAGGGEFGIGADYYVVAGITLAFDLATLSTTGNSLSLDTSINFNTSIISVTGYGMSLDESINFNLIALTVTGQVLTSNVNVVLDFDTSTITIDGQSYKLNEIISFTLGDVIISANDFYVSMGAYLRRGLGKLGCSMRCN